jgi:hypothetical protein
VEWPLEVEAEAVVEAVRSFSACLASTRAGFGAKAKGIFAVEHSSPSHGHRVDSL